MNAMSYLGALRPILLETRTANLPRSNVRSEIFVAVTTRDLSAGHDRWRRVVCIKLPHFIAATVAFQIVKKNVTAQKHQDER